MPIRAVKSFLGLLAVVMLAAAPALAHHGSSGYDNSKPVTLAGTITYPHATSKLDVSGKAYELR